MNRDVMLVALGVGVGALITTDQGRHFIGTLAKTPVAQALGESTMNLFKNMEKEPDNKERMISDVQSAAVPHSQHEQHPQHEQAETAEHHGEDR